MISIVVVNYKTLDITLNTLRSVVEFTQGTPYELIVVDNASGEQEFTALKMACDAFVAQGVKMHLIGNETNLGFGRANNQGFALGTGDYVGLLNSDTELTTDTFSKAVAYLIENPKVGAVGSRLVTPDGKLDQGCKRGFPSPKASLYYFLKVHKWLRRPELDIYKLTHLDEYTTHAVDVISGAVMILPKAVIDSVGPFDERFFMYGEDIDWCYRIKESGFEVIYNPDLGTVIHYKGASGKKRKFKTLYNFYEAMVLFYNKHYFKKYNILISICVYLGICAQFVLKLVWNYRPTDFHQKEDKK